MSTIIMIGLAIAVSYISSGIINLKQVKEEKSFFKKAIAVFPKTKKAIIYCTLMLLYMVALAVVITKCYSGNLCEYAKIITLTSLMWPMAQIDYKYMKIPNKLIFVGLIYRVIIFVVEIIFYRSGLLSVVISEVTACLGIAIILFVSQLVIKGGIGMGDIKFFMLMGLMLGIYNFVSVLLVVMIIAFFVALYKLIIKKADKKSEFSFGPVIALGSLIGCMIFGN